MITSWAHYLHTAFHKKVCHDTRLRITKVCNQNSLLQKDNVKAASMKNKKGRPAQSCSRQVSRESMQANLLINMSWKNLIRDWWFFTLDQWLSSYSVITRRKITQSTVPNHNSDIFKAKKGVTILGNVTIMSGHSNCYWGLKDVRHITYRARLSQNKIIFDRSHTSGSNRNSLYKSRCS